MTKYSHGSYSDKIYVPFTRSVTEPAPQNSITNYKYAKYNRSSLITNKLTDD